VALQLKVAMGEPLPMKQSEIRFSGHAIELRINAEDVMEGFRPAIGTITDWRRPSVEPQGTREDYGYRVGDSIPPFYDSLISKVIIHAASRAEALYTTFTYLRDYWVEGVPTTVPFHAWIVSNEAFQTTGIDIGYVERTFNRDEAEKALALLRRDPEHHSPSDSGELFSEVITDGAELPSGATSLKLTHEPGGTFLAVPLDTSGKPLSQQFWRRSNTRAGALSDRV
jgi:acetyl/propionyl-CoA carboxylase alpha subunit